MTDDLFELSGTESQPMSDGPTRELRLTCKGCDHLTNRTDFDTAESYRCRVGHEGEKCAAVRLIPREILRMAPSFAGVFEPEFIAMPFWCPRKPISKEPTNDQSTD